MKTLVLIASLLIAVPAHAGWDAQRDNQGRVIGYFAPQPGGALFVYDCRSRKLGYVNMQGTFTNSGRKLAYQQQPWTLLNRAKNCPEGVRDGR